MKHSPSQKIGILFLLIGIVLIILWGYMKTSKAESEGGNNLQIQSGVPNENTNTAPPEVTQKTLSMGVVELFVADKEKVGSFYRDIVGFDVMSESGNILDL